MGVRTTAMALVGIAWGLVAQAAEPLDVVPHVDLERYLGTWYEVASIPVRFQRGCVATEAHYSRDDRGRIRVVNRCHEGSFDGPEKVARGRAWVVDPSTNARLKVQFFWPFWGDYQIVELDDDYQWAVVGEPRRRNLWILSRERTLDPEILDRLVARARDHHGYDVSALTLTPQP